MSEAAFDEAMDAFSASRIGTVSRCGLAYRYKYIDRIPAAFDRSATMLGHAVHDGLREWYGPDEAPADFQTVALTPIVLAQWERLLPQTVWAFVQQLRDLDEECAAVAAAIQFKRPNLKAPSQTKEYLESGAVKRFTEKRAEMLAKCEQITEIKWPKDEDAYKAYCKSAEIADRMQARWQKLPRPLAVERPFVVQIGGHKVRGRIDQYRADPHPVTGEAFLCMTDVKTGRNLLSPMEAILQAFFYTEGIRSFEDLPDLPQDKDNIAFYHARSDRYQQGRIDIDRHRTIALRILNDRARQIITGQFAACYGMWCKSCDYEDMCADEISLWQGDGITAQLGVGT